MGTSGETNTTLLTSSIYIGQAWWRRKNIYKEEPKLSLGASLVFWVGLCSCLELHIFVVVRQNPGNNTIPSTYGNYIF